MSAALVKEAWDRIETWCRQHHPQLIDLLNPGASEDEIKAVESVIKQRLPEDVRTSLMIHNGQSRNHPAFLFGQIALASCERITGNWKLWQGCDLDDARLKFYPEDAIVHRYYDPGWIPIAVENNNCLAVDLAPGSAGICGQVITYGRDIYNLGVVAPSWGEFLLSNAKLLESGILGEISSDVDNWWDDFYSVWDRACLDALLVWVKDGRWPIITFDLSWRTSSVMALAKGIEETRDFSTMPILADALQEAGCENATILNHCRDSNCKHAQGCWVVDSLLWNTVKKGRLCGVG
jgi:cell wall assembly regulator SMI1